MSEHLRLYAEGKAFENKRFELRSLENILTNYRRTIDHILPLLMGKQELSSKNKKDIRYDVQVQSGSLEVILDFINDNQELLALFQVDGGVTISSLVSKMISNVIDFRRFFTKILESGLEPKVKIDGNIQGDNNMQVQMQTGQITINNPIIVIGAERSRAAIDNLINQVDGRNVQYIDISHDKTATKLTEEDHNLTGTQKEELSNSIEIAGRLDVVAFTSHTGAVITQNGKYPVRWDENIRELIHDVADVEGIIFKVRPIIDKRLFKDEPVAYHIIGCRNPQTGIDGI